MGRRPTAERWWRSLTAGQRKRARLVKVFRRFSSQNWWSWLKILLTNIKWAQHWNMNASSKLKLIIEPVSWFLEDDPFRFAWHIFRCYLSFREGKSFTMVEHIRCLQFGSFKHVSKLILIVHVWFIFWALCSLQKWGLGQLTVCYY